MTEGLKSVLIEKKCALHPEKNVTVEMCSCVCAGDSGARARRHFTSKKSLAAAAPSLPSVHNSLSLPVLRNLFVNNTGAFHNSSI